MAAGHHVFIADGSGRKRADTDRQRPGVLLDHAALHPVREAVRRGLHGGGKGSRVLIEPVQITKALLVARVVSLQPPVENINHQSSRFSHARSLIFSDRCRRQIADSLNQGSSRRYNSVNRVKARS